MLSTHLRCCLVELRDSEIAYMDLEMQLCGSDDSRIFDVVFVAVSNQVTCIWNCAVEELKDS